MPPGTPGHLGGVEEEAGHQHPGLVLLVGRRQQPQQHQGQVGRLQGRLEDCLVAI